MSYLRFDKTQLVNLEYSLLREVLYTNKTGGYLNTTLVGCNTRKYHGLFVLPIEKQFRRLLLLMSCFLFSQRSNGANICYLAFVVMLFF